MKKIIINFNNYENIVLVYFSIIFLVIFLINRDSIYLLSSMLSLCFFKLLKLNKINFLKLF